MSGAVLSSAANRTAQGVADRVTRGRREAPVSQSGKFRSTKPASAPLWEPDEAPTERARFVTNPMSARPPGGPTAGGISNPFGTAPASSRALSADAPTPAVPLASLLEDTQEDRLWGGSDGERKTALEAAEQDLTLYRLAIDATNLNYEQSFTILALTVEFFHKGEHVERVEQHAPRVAAGVILRVQKQLNSEPLRILAPFYLNQLRSIFQAWHLYRELAKAIDNRGDFLVRMRGKGDQLILDSLFSEEGRSMLAARVDGFTSACARLQLNSEALKRAEWIGKLLMYRTENDQWQVPPEACLGLCTRLLREINDDTVMGAIRNLAAASWDGLCKETNYLRDGFAGIVTEDTGHGVILIRTAVPMVGIPVLPAEDSVSYFPEHDAFREQDKDKRERPKDGVFRLIV